MRRRTAARILRADLRGASVTWTRVVLAALPTMVADIVRESLAPHFDLQVVAEVDSRTALSRLLATTSAEVVIAGLANGESPDEFASLLRVHPDLTVLAITLDGHTAYHCTMRMVVGVISEVSLQQLLDALRAREGVHRDLHLISFQWPIAGPIAQPDN